MSERSGARPRRGTLVLALCGLAGAVALLAARRGSGPASSAPLDPKEAGRIALEDRREGELPQVVGGSPASSTELAHSESALAQLQRDERRAATPDLSDDVQWVEGRVVFPPGALLDEATVVVARSSARFEGRSGTAARITRARVGADGRFRVAFAPRARHGSLWVHGTWLFQPVPLAIELRPPPADVVLEPALAGRVRGRLLAPDGRGFGPGELEGASVSAGSGAKNDDLQDIDRAHATPIAPDGSFVLDGLAPAVDRSLWFDLPMLVDASVEGIEVRAGEITELEVPSARAVRVSGRVLDEEGRALAGVRVTVTGDFQLAHGGSASGASDEHGAFDLRGLAAGELAIELVAREHLPIARALGEHGAGEHLADLEFTLASGLSIAGRITWPDGAPVRGASVDLVAAEDGRKSFETRSEEDGAFRLRGLPEGRFHLSAKARDWRQGARVRREAPNAVVRVEDLPAGTQELALVLGSGVVLDGRVEDVHGRPVASFGIEAFPTGGGRRAPSFEGVAQDFESADGRFALSGLDDGTYVVTANAHGYLDSAPMQCTPRAGDELVLVVHPPALVSGLVVDPTGKHVAGAWIEYWTTPTDRSAQLTSKAGERRLETTRADGSFGEIEALGGRVTLRAGAEGHGDSEPLSIDVAAGEGRRGLVLRLTSLGRITGVVHAYQGEVAGREVRLGGARVVHTCATEASGRFEFEGLSAGEYTLTLLADDDRADVAVLPASERSRDIRTRLRDVARERVDLSSGASVHVVLGSPPVAPIRVHGVVREAGRPVPGEFVFVRRASESPSSSRTTKALTGKDGQYEFVLDGAGKYALHVRDAHNVGLEFPFELTAGTDLRFDVELPTGCISGIIVGPEGPLAGVGVAVARMGGAQGRSGGAGSSNTGEDGRFRIGRLPAGTYQVGAGGYVTPFSGTTPLARSVRHGLELGEGEELADVRLELSAGGAIEGRVLDADGAPVAGADVEILDLEGARLYLFSGTRTDAHGRFRATPVRTGPVRLRAYFGNSWIATEATVIEGGTTFVELRAGE